MNTRECLEAIADIIDDGDISCWLMGQPVDGARATVAKVVAETMAMDAITYAESVIKTMLDIISPNSPEADRYGRAVATCANVRADSERKSIKLAENLTRADREELLAIWRAGDEPRTPSGRSYSRDN